MAQFVGYWDDHCDFREGPFVLCGGPTGASRPRIEVQSDRKPGTPCVPDPSIAELRHLHGKYAGTAEEVDWLNALVREGKIVEREDTWVAVTGNTGAACRTSRSEQQRPR